MKNNTLHLTLKKKWFDMIASGQKKEEYREIKPYWAKRLNGKAFCAVEFRNGYGKSAPSVLVELIGIRYGIGKSDWGAPPRRVYIIDLGRLLNDPDCVPCRFGPEQCRRIKTGCRLGRNLYYPKLPTHKKIMAWVMKIEQAHRDAGKSKLVFKNG